MTIRGSFSRLDRHAVLAQNLNRGAVQRLATLDRHQKDLAAAINVFLRQDSDVGDEQKPAVTGGLDRFLFLRIPTARGQKEKATLAPSICRLPQVLGKIQSRIIRLPFDYDRNQPLLDRTSREAFFVEIHPRMKLRILKH